MLLTWPAGIYSARVAEICNDGLANPPLPSGDNLFDLSCKHLNNMNQNWGLDAGTCTGN